MLKIVVVDDSNVMLKIIEGIIKAEVKIETQVTSYLNASEFKDKLLELSPDLVITDIDMPNVDGYELISFVKSRSNVPIVAISGSRISDNCTDTLLYCAKGFGADYTLNKVDLNVGLSRLVSDILLKNITVEYG
ncbi:MAG: response regulator [Colwellia sp.]|nr:response regulator [Colwellia sp.]NQZ80158.1 response regulator [Colwellia sp.]